MNSLTKYPSIDTYHKLGDRGSVTEQRQVAFSGRVVVTEKIDGGNGRIIFLPGGDFLVGSREELLTAKGDRVANPALGMVDALRPVAERLALSADFPRDDQAITTFYLEVYGSRHFQAWKSYGIGGDAGSVRLFDVSRVPLEMLGKDAREIAPWRDGGGQEFRTESALVSLAETLDLPPAPRVAVLDAERLPAGSVATLAWLREILPGTRAAIDPAGTGKPEGVVVRSEDRESIAKVRFEDSERAERKSGQGRKG